MSGEPCFRGTRVPVQILMDHLEGNANLDEFLDGFPSVTRKQAIKFMELAKALWAVGAGDLPDGRCLRRIFRR